MEQETGTKHMQALNALENLRMRLLDLTSRNRLINFRHTASGSLRIIDELPNEMARILLADTEMRFAAIPEPTEKELIASGFLEINAETQQLIASRNDPTAEEWAKHLGFATSYEVPEYSDDDEAVKHTDTTIQTLLYPYEMEARLKKLSQSAESAIQEMGTNILYLAFGFLEWYESASNGNAHIAPLFLMPAHLHKGRLNPVTSTYEYTLSYSGDDIIPNLSLREKLRADFALALPSLDENTMPEDYFREIQLLIKDNQPRWRIRRYVTLTLLNFNKLLMYLDLDPACWPDDANIVDHPVISSFLSGYEQEKEVEDLCFSEEYSIDEIDNVHTGYPLIDDADSSQHSALIDAINGKNLVIEGPPGTGKSQTITNLIAAAMAQGKKILFVAEKLAALEVVRRRLDKAGLGEFCLELHSHKTQKRKVLEEVGQRLMKHGYYRKPKDIDVDIARYEDLKDTLRNHAEKINLLWKKTGKTSHEIFMGATRYRNAIEINPEKLHPTKYNGDNYDTTTQRLNEDQIESYRKVYHAVASQLNGYAILQEHPWYGVRNSDLQIFDLDRVKDSLSSWQESIQQLSLHRDEIVHTLGCDDLAVVETITEAHSFLDELKKIPTPKGDEIFERLPVLRGDVLEKAQLYLKLFENIQILYASLAKKVRLEILQDITTADQMVSCSKQLKQLVEPKMKVSDLAEEISRLAVIEGKLMQFNEPLQGVLSALGESAARYLTISESGLTEFKTVIELVTNLNPSYWKHRDELFDNEELDEILPELRAELKVVLNLHSIVHSVFSLEDVPDEIEIRQLSNTLYSGGMFRWFKKDWRAARKQLLSYAVNTQITYANMMPLLDDLADYVGKCRKLDNNTRYKDALGKHLRGLDTDLSALEALRVWYKRVRQQYGVGFGQKVLLGDGILSLLPSIGKAIRSLAERGMISQLEDLLDDLNSLKAVFAPNAELRSEGTLLVGNKGIIPYLINTVNQSIQACDSLFNDNSLTVGELAKHIEQIERLKQYIDKWQNADLDRKLFHEKLGLTIGVGIDNSAGLSMMHNTLELAACIDGQLCNQILVNYIYEHPTEATFSFLNTYAKNLSVTLASQKASYSTYAALVHLDHAGWTVNSSDRIEELIDRNQLALNNGEFLQNWLDYVRVRDQLETLGLNRLVYAVEHCEIQVDQVKDAYLASIYDLLAREILRESPEFARFSGRAQEAIQEKFKEYDNKLKQLQCEQIAWKIDQATIPIGNMGARVSERTEKTLLEHECNKKTRHIPIRQLLKRAGNALLALKPCFMLSPMSVSQYLAPGRITFDMVVMDEASQIKPQDALGAVARGGQLVVVGDPKQLPPTSFFERIVGDEEDDPTGIEESESILDATSTMFPSRRLRWHYRSQHEKLIAFSNEYFYENNLVLFPSPYNESKDYGIQYHRVQRGCFVNRRNMEEAKIISETIREHFKYHPEETLGVVAMNDEQRQQIEMAKDTLAKDDPLFQEWLARDETRYESLFIKNLENVQGDERDVIFISMTYGPQEPGSNHIYQRFGPINSDVGWRRLNVLFTRSKKRMHVFSSMKAEHIKIGSDSKRGVHALHNFLKYCETGILHKTEKFTGKDPDSDFEIAVMNALRQEGFECVPQVGVAGFFIDLAVIDPGNQGRYLMGIECDGMTYHSAKSARDRDRLRQSILERLGWRIRRIWSTDWFKNPYGELAPIIRELHKLKSPVLVSEPKTGSEGDEIARIIKTVEVEEAQVDQFALDGMSLKDKLIRFDREVIRKKHPETPEDKRLLRPRMLEALLEYTPTSKVEFLEMIPSYIRLATDEAEHKYLEQVFEIINASFEET